jgi:hypothetical protein
MNFFYAKLLIDRFINIFVFQNYKKVGNFGFGKDDFNKKLN